MPRVEFVDNDADEVLSVEAPEGGALVDICDAALAPVAFSCRSATCATCQVEIEAGAELLDAPGLAERDLLLVLGEPENVRLACRALVRGGGGVIRLKPFGT